MKRRLRFRLIGLVSLTLLVITCAERRKGLVPDSITIAVTDSGLGGLSVMAEAAARLREAGLYRRVDLVFFNALFSNDSGYNSLPTRQEKIRVFDAALRGLEKAVRPDLILVACNTLSVLLPDTPFAQKTKIPMHGIVEPGVEMFKRALDEKPEARLLLFGTETTIAEDSHRHKLQAAGIPAGRIIVQACPELAGRIEDDWRGDDAGLLISAYVDEATAGLPQPPAPLLIGLACTHYGYARDLWTAAFAERGLNDIRILDPNPELAAGLVPRDTGRRFDKTEISARVLSMVDIPGNTRDSLAAWLDHISPEVAAALRSAEIRPSLFSIR
ncbi:MAG: aspartate/glutamate racemase family protein [Acidobacteriota bacterium]|nr:aspartate/glutamate racemase family protein [Acidobacteriota bacterium]